MSELPSWVPSDEEIHLHLISKGGIRTINDYCRIVKDILTTAVERALAEQEQVHSAATEDLMSRFRGLQAEQDTRHKREVIEAQIEAACEWVSDEWPEGFGEYMDALRAELAALPKVTP